MVRISKVVLNFSIRKKEEKEKNRERMSEGGEVLSLKANTVEEALSTSWLPLKIAPLYQLSKHKPQLFPRSRQSPHAVASLSHATVEQS